MDESHMDELHMDESHKQCTTGRRIPIGCLKLQIIVRKRATNYRAPLQKMTYKDKASYGSSPPCTSRVTQKMPYMNDLHQLSPRHVTHT